VALPKFFETFDRVGWSVWSCVYKYNKDLAKQLFTFNLLGGFLQRIENDARKYSFGSFAIVGDDSNQAIYGAWIFRGQEVIDIMKECDDYELYDWRKLNIDNPEDKKYLEDIFAQDVAIDNKPFIQGKNFK